jgi:hypothetical protein
MLLQQPTYVHDLVVRGMAQFDQQLGHGMS